MAEFIAPIDADGVNIVGAPMVTSDAVTVGDLGAGPPTPAEANISSATIFVGISLG